MSANAPIVYQAQRLAVDLFTIAMEHRIQPPYGYGLWPSCIEMAYNLIFDEAPFCEGARILWLRDIAVDVALER